MTHKTPGAERGKAGMGRPGYPPPQCAPAEATLGYVIPTDGPQGILVGRGLHVHHNAK